MISLLMLPASTLAPNPAAKPATIGCYESRLEPLVTITEM
jgi:hypothetical protein